MNEDKLVGSVVAYYEGKLALHGPTAKGVDWKDEASQLLRFEQLLRAIRNLPKKEATILDYGCGYGALLPFLRERGYDLAYIGYDRSAKMIAQAQQLYSDIEGAKFTSSWDSLGPVDYVVASGIFNVRLGMADEEWLEYVLQTLSALDGKAAWGWSSNFLTSYADEDRKRPDLYYADPSFLFDWCKRTASRSVCLLHDYELYEFTIGVTHGERPSIRS